MLKWIPVDDPSSTAADAGEIYQLDFGPIFAGYTEGRSFRLGNLAATAVTYSFTLDGDEFNSYPSDGYEVPDAGTIPPGGTSDTLTLRITPPVDRGNRSWVLALIASANGEPSTTIPVTFESVVDRDRRRNEAALRSTSQTEVFTRQIDRTCEWFRLWRFDPIPYDPDLQRRIIVEPGQRELEGEAGTHRFRSVTDPCERLNPSNHDWGYTESWSFVRAHWQPETDLITETFTFDNTDITYASTASIIIPAPYHLQLQREWKLFAPASGADKAQYKRTVFILERNDEMWAVQDVILPPLGDRLAYCEARVIQLHNPAMGSKQYYNPFAFTFELESDKPYRKYPCECLFDWHYDEYHDEYGSPIEGEPPIPLTAEWWRSTEGEPIIVTWSSPLQPYSESEAGWRVGTAENGTTYLTYEPPPFTLVGINGIPVEAFTIPLTIIGT